MQNCPYFFHFVHRHIDLVQIAADHLLEAWNHQTSELCYLMDLKNSWQVKGWCRKKINDKYHRVIYTIYHHGACFIFFFGIRYFCSYDITPLWTAFTLKKKNNNTNMKQVDHRCSEMLWSYLNIINKIFMQLEKALP